MPRPSGSHTSDAWKADCKPTRRTSAPVLVSQRERWPPPYAATLVPSGENTSCPTPQPCRSRVAPSRSTPPLGNGSAGASAFSGLAAGALSDFASAGGVASRAGGSAKAR